jgi:hypothetical protein
MVVAILEPWGVEKSTESTGLSLSQKLQQKNFKDKDFLILNLFLKFINFFN